MFCGCDHTDSNDEIIESLSAEYTSIDELKAGVFAAREQDINSFEGTKRILHERFALANMKNILVPLSDFGGLRLTTIMVYDDRISYIYTEYTNYYAVVVVHISRPENVPAESVYNKYAKLYGKENEIGRYLYHRRAGRIVSVIDDYCVQISVVADSELNDFEYLKKCFTFETVSF